VDPVPGWYPDPSSSARLRWWDGSRWTDDTRDLPGHAAPPPPSGPSGPGPDVGFDYRAAPTARTAAAPPPAAGPDRTWISWASIGAVIAVALAAVLILSIAVLGHSSSPPSSQGLATTTTGAAAGGSSTSTTPTTPAVAPPPGGTLFNDPAGLYSLYIDDSWEVPSIPTGYVAAWYLTGVNYAGLRSFLGVSTETVAAPASLDAFVAAQEQRISHLVANTHVGAASPLTLADGSAAQTFSYTFVLQGQAVTGEAVLTTKGGHEAIVTVIANSDAAPSTFGLADPFVRTLHLN
jgi:hypothetical protein